VLGRGRARAAAILLALLVGSGRDVCWGDQWPAAQVREVWSPSRDHFVRVTPGTGVGETVGFSGAPTGPAATAEFYRRASDRSYRPVWMVSLVNPVAPSDAFLTDRGYLATLDDWHNMGYGKVVAFYAPTGARVRTYALADLPHEARARGDGRPGPGPLLRSVVGGPGRSPGPHGSPDGGSQRPHHHVRRRGSGAGSGPSAT